jgi:hypothetical protein
MGRPPARAGSNLDRLLRPARSFEVLACRSGGGLRQPVLEAGLAEPRTAARNQRALAHLRAEVARVRISDDLARIFFRAEAASDQGVEAELLGAGHFDGAIQRRAMGWMSTGAMRTISPSVAAAAMLLTNSKNCVARTIE